MVISGSRPHLFGNDDLIGSDIFMNTIYRPGNRLAVRNIFFQYGVLMFETITPLLTDACANSP